MTFPTITFKHTNIEPDYTLQQLVTDKLASLSKYLGGARDVRAEVEFEKILAKDSATQCRIELNLRRSGTLVRAEAAAASFEKAVDVVKAHAEAELLRAHDKRVSVVRRGARVLKDLVRFGR